MFGVGGAFLGALAGTGFDASGPGSYAEALAVLATIVGIHEAGHFAAARLQGIHVTKFAIGFGPPLLRYQGERVEYSLRAIPLGGYVAFPDDDPEAAEAFPADDPDLLKNRSIPERALVISAGVLANCLFALAILTTQVSTVGVVESRFLTGVQVPEVAAASVAERAGLRSGDTILAVDGREVPASSTAVARVVRAIVNSPERTLDLTVRRPGGDTVHLPVTPALASDGGGRIGVQLSANAALSRRVAAGPGQALAMAAGEFRKLLNVVTTGLQQIVFNFAKTADAVSGPVAIVAVGAEVARADASGLFQFAAIVNINLAVVNLLPLPALDGGYLALLVVEAARGRKLPKTLEQTIMASGLLLLSGLGFFLILRDVGNLTGLTRGGLM
ncbi:hypothetical protein WJX81_001563 [Elliptochloris bilobata]|uniref:PDZ domain-containing protein n=1 Tax=Elliptochloris bilobata TaxID=381761 RepID=A0AAW1QHZ8_9CHLO